MPRAFLKARSKEEQRLALAQRAQQDALAVKQQNRRLREANEEVARKATHAARARSAPKSRLSSTRILG